MRRLYSAWADSQYRAKQGSMLLALVLAVLAAASVQSLLNALVVQRAVARDAVTQAVRDARSVELLMAATGTDAAPEADAWLRRAVSGPEVVSARLVDRSGDVIASAPAEGSAPHRSPGQLWNAQDAWPSLGGTAPAAADGGTPASTRWVGRRLHVSVALNEPATGKATGAALQLVLDGSPLSARAGTLQRQLVAVVGAGGMVTIGLWLLLAGRGTRRRKVSAPDPMEGLDGRLIPGDAADGITGLPGLRTFIAHLERGVTWANSTGEPLALALVDLNDIAGVRDTDGRCRADRLLRKTADLLRGCPGLPYQVAGDGFSIIMPGTQPAVARALVEGLAGDIAQEAAPLTADVVVVQLDPVVAPDAHSLLIRAETELADSRERRAFVQAHIMVGPEHLVPQPDRWDTRWLDDDPF